MLKNKITFIQAQIALLVLFIVFYLLARGVFLVYVEYTPLEQALAVLFLLSEVFLMFQAFGYFGTIYGLNKQLDSESLSFPEDRPPVAILVPSRHEPKEVLRQTFRHLKAINYENKEIYFLDDSSEASFCREAEEVAEEFGAKIFRRSDRHGAKAGIVNDCLKTLNTKYVAIFDADQNPLPGFLTKIIPILEADAKLAFVQTPQFYSNIRSTRVSHACNLQQSVFYEYICEGKSSSGSMICCGTNVVFRAEALKDIGGFDETSVTEDFATTVNLHLKKWKTVYYNHVGAFGKGPENLEEYFKQQNRWAQGNAGVFRKVLFQFIKNPLALKPAQWFQYFITGSFYCVGIAYLFLVFCPIVYILFNIPSFFVDPRVYLLTFVPYFMLSLLIFYSCMGQRNYSIKQMLLAQSLAFITIPVYIKAFLSGIIGKKATFQVTSKESSGTIPYRFLWTQLVLWSINLIALVWGTHRLFYERSGSILMNYIWLIWHFLLLSSVFYFNEPKDLEGDDFPRLPGKYRLEYQKTNDTAFQDTQIYNYSLCFQTRMDGDLKKGDTLLFKLTSLKEDNIVFYGKIVWLYKSGREKNRVGILIDKIDETNRERMKKKFS